MSDNSDGIPGLGAVIGVFTAIIGLAMVAIIISQKANTSNIIQAVTSGGSSLIQAAVAPVSGGSS